MYRPDFHEQHANPKPDDREDAKAMMRWLFEESLRGSNSKVQTQDTPDETATPNAREGLARVGDATGATAASDRVTLTRVSQDAGPEIGSAEDEEALLEALVARGRAVVKGLR